jgi:hypothetical protein
MRGKEEMAFALVVIGDRVIVAGCRLCRRTTA